MNILAILRAYTSLQSYLNSRKLSKGSKPRSSCCPTQWTLLDNILLEGWATTVIDQASYNSI